MAMKVRYTVVHGQVISENRNGVRRDYIPDALGNTIALMDSTGAKTDTFEYFPSGTVSARTGTTATPFQWNGGSGYYRDSASRSYVRARHLSTSQGRWQSQDPIGFDAGDYNLYRYVGSNFINKNDPSGLQEHVAKPNPGGSSNPPNPLRMVDGGGGNSRTPWLPGLLKGAGDLFSKFANNPACKCGILAGGVFAIYELCTYQPGGPPVGPLTRRGQDLADWLLPLPMPDGPSNNYRQNPTNDPHDKKAPPGSVPGDQKKKKKGDCKPCPPNRVLIQGLHGGNDHHDCIPITGKPDHWHCVGYHQNPYTCQCHFKYGVGKCITPTEPAPSTCVV